MSIWRRKPRRPWTGSAVLDMQLKDPGDRYHRVEVLPLVRRGPGAQLIIQSGPIASVSKLDEEEVHKLAKALLDALAASQKPPATGDEPQR
jgi:hypothetical protein